MTDFFQTRVNTKIKRVFKATASVLLIAIMSFVMILSSNSDVFAGTGSQNERWAITIGDEEVLYVDSEESAKQVIEGLKDYYLTKGSTVLDIQFDPAISYKKAINSNSADDRAYSAQADSIIDVKAAVEQLSDGKVEYYVYQSEEGDTLESIAKDNGISAKKLVTLNFGEYDSDETIKEGTYLVLCREVPYVEVITKEKITSTKSIDYETVYKRTSSLKKGTFKVTKKGVKGAEQLVEEVVKVNGEETSSELISSQVLKESSDKIVLKGTSSVTAKKGVTYDFVEGSEIVAYAKKFVGNPYRYGGTSLTKGADCSGFVYAVYKHFGINLPRVGQTSVGKIVSYKNVQKGDILVYSGHVAIYAGNGKAVHAVNERLGIRVTSVGYTGSVQCVVRIAR